MSQARHAAVFRALDRIAARTSSLRIVDVGVHDGEPALSAIHHWLAGSPTHACEYLGCGLLDACTPELLKGFPTRPLPPSASRDLHARLEEALGSRGLGVLVVGDPVQPFSCPEADGPADLLLFDGGRPQAAVLAEWKAFEWAFGPSTVAVIGDVYVNRLDIGGAQLVHLLQRQPDLVVELTPEADYSPFGDLFIRSATVSRK